MPQHGQAVVSGRNGEVKNIFTCTSFVSPSGRQNAVQKPSLQVAGLKHSSAARHNFKAFGTPLGGQHSFQFRFDKAPPNQKLPCLIFGRTRVAQRDTDNCHPSRHPSLPQQIPLARRAARRKPPVPLQPVVLTAEQRATARYELAHQLWLNGNPDAARRWLAELADKWPDTAVADRARVTLAKL
jgi:hypothetical protein